MKFKFDYMVAIGFILALIFMHNAIVYGGGLGIAVVGEWLAIVGLFALGIWAMIVKDVKQVHPAETDVKHGPVHLNEKKIEG